MIQVAGTLAGRFHRKSTGVRTWEQAQALSVQWERLATWQKVLGEAAISEPAPLPQSEESAPPITFVRAIQAYLEDHRSPNGRNSAVNTIKKYSETLGQLRRFSEAKGYTRVDHTRRSGISVHVAGFTSVGR